MSNPEIQLPKSTVLMVSARDYRLSSLNGTVVNFKRDVPTKVPPNAYVEAIGCGAVLCEGEDLDAEVEQKNTVHPSIEEADKISKENAASALTKALVVVIERNDPADFKADGTPKHQKVVAELSPEIPKPSATEISDAYQLLQENFDLAED